MVEKLLVLTIGLLFSYSHIEAQQNIDGNFLFKMWFFVEKRNVDTTSMNNNLSNKQFTSKDHSLFDFFEKNISLCLDTLKSGGLESFVFLSASVSKSIKFYDSSMIKMDERTKSDLAWYLLIGSNCDKYVVGINKFTGVSYRLSGFDGNDFFAFLDDEKRAYYYEHYKKLDNKQFFKECSVEGLDFKCIYNALTAIDYYDSKKYPCLKKCSAMTGLHYTEPWH
jgi:hypothetical protein